MPPDLISHHYGYLPFLGQAGIEGAKSKPNQSEMQELLSDLRLVVALQWELRKSFKPSASHLLVK